MLNDIDDALFPQQIVKPDGRKFQVQRNDALEGDKDGNGFDDRKKKEENGN